ncbi:UNVERIFIED_CONTAM: Acidic endochitinase [Sesamum angustifolium]|uniref:Acidic endochitinase n=1 Tax=Sesamum angustifolium TaxID=2727405 RepID=A0AAW2PTE8_9LAMI
MATSYSQPTKPQLMILISCILVAFSLFSTSSEAAPCGKISVYWGQNLYERSLLEACHSNLYDYVNLAFLVDFGRDVIQPNINLAGHCVPESGDCRRLITEIQACQDLGVKVLLSLGGSIGNYGLSSPDDAKLVAAKYTIFS